LHIYIYLVSQLSNKITSLSAMDIRFPTSDSLDGSDATNKDPDYSAAYIVVETEQGNTGYGLIFTIGRGNDICCTAVESMRHLVIGADLEDITANIGDFYNKMRSDSQLKYRRLLQQNEIRQPAKMAGTRERRHSYGRRRHHECGLGFVGPHHG
jgi:hypothetical protein